MYTWISLRGSARQKRRKELPTENTYQNTSTRRSEQHPKSKHTPKTKYEKRPLNLPTQKIG
jgi:hypothetical protein